MTSAEPKNHFQQFNASIIYIQHLRIPLHLLIYYTHIRNIYLYMQRTKMFKFCRKFCARVCV